MANTEEYVVSLCREVKAAAPSLAEASSADKNRALAKIAEKLESCKDEIIKANEKDLAGDGVPAKMLDRLRLDGARIDGIAASLRELILLADPVGGGERWTRPNGLDISRVRVPIGVIAIIYEARPNVTVDAAAMCIKTGNGVLLRGGKEAVNTNRVLMSVMKAALEETGLDPAAIALVDDVTRESTNVLMRQREYVDVLIPRGSASLIRAVKENASVPVIETGAGNCHVYVDRSADINMAVSVTINAKASRPSVCNSAETLLVHKDIAEAFLPEFARAAANAGTELRGCAETKKIIGNIPDASDEDYATEYNDYIMAVKVVDSIDEAIAHINLYNTGHSEAIITKDLDSAKKFQSRVDAAAVYVNASTRFTDGGEFGFGAEIGISTQKLHARGPMGLESLTTMKYLISGNGQIR